MEKWAIFRARPLPVAAAMLIAVTLAAGCAGSFTYGQRDAELTQAFSSHQFPPGYRYYFLGGENRPYAIVGLEPDYTLSNKFYKPVTEADRPMEKLVDALYEVPYSRPDAAHIVDLQGRRIGVWYSSARLVSFRVDPEARSVSVFSDEPWIKDGANGDFYTARFLE
ncbi:MAG: hypothetical protein LJE65_10610 [Desulfobacteraceae bacterium]|nr:hypothetical protein [Desulfobacteraceae bacterium]